MNLLKSVQLKCKRKVCIKMLTPNLQFINS
uniref:Uncharacterized protein n=1 Tax=Podoviridae sp. ctrub15 TaxID=2826581 RepID=A0A8S5LUS4_9CAUD|nr:MAG TPA: hypothetical protein [Podoviridae sp. ctrub15]